MLNIRNLLMHFSQDNKYEVQFITNTFLSENYSLIFSFNFRLKTPFVLRRSHVGSLPQPVLLNHMP